MLNPDRYPALTPLIHPWIEHLLMDKELLKNAVATHQSPLNVLHKQPFAENITAFRNLLKSYKLDHQIFFARKANKAAAYVSFCKDLGCGVDTASYDELAQALALGVAPQQLICTAAVKNEKLITLAIQHQVEMAIDNDDECQLIQQIAHSLGKDALINVRVSGFRYLQHMLPSRFGFLLTDVVALLQKTRPGQDYDRLRYQGIHFHLNGYSVSQRGEAILQCLDLIDKLTSLGYTTKSLDMGGGILINYLTSKSQWHTFMETLKQAVLHKTEEVTYQNDPLGMQILDGTIYGEPTVYPYYNELAGPLFVEAVLKHKNTEQQPIYTLLRDRNLEFRMEPGRSALDQAGITVARVMFRKHDTDGNYLVGLEMNRTQLRSSSADFLLDPIHLPAQQHAEAHTCYGYLVGAYCLEQELILKRKLKFHTEPKVGDLIVFVNTAGYMMHFYESEAHLFPLAANVVYQSDSKTFVQDAHTL